MCRLSTLATRVPSLLMATILAGAGSLYSETVMAGGDGSALPALRDRGGSIKDLLDAAREPPAATGQDNRRILVRFRPVAAKALGQGTIPARAQDRVLRRFGLVEGLHLIEVPAGTAAAAIRAYRADPNVLYAEPDYEVRIVDVPNDPSFDLLWGLRNTGQTVNNDPGTPGADVRAPEAWDIWTGDPDIRIAVIDSGVDYGHPDLAGNIWTNLLELNGVTGVDDDNNGYVDDIHGYDFLNDDGDPMDDHSHGTHVAGTIGAFGDNATGVVGVNWRCRIVALKFIGPTGGGYTSDAVEAVQYAAGNGIRVSNNSWGGVYFSQALRDAIEAARVLGHVFVAAAGNGDPFLGTPLDTDVFPHYPSSYDLANIISVGATNNDDIRASFTNYGRTSVDLSAPGVFVYSTRPGTGYTFKSGTSMASPHVAGVVALVMGRSPWLNWPDVWNRIVLTARPVEGLETQSATGGVLNALAAIGDCNENGFLDEDDISAGRSLDCNTNGIPDECEIFDCNDNGVPDSCDIGSVSVDCNSNGIPDECEPDCNENGTADACDISGGGSPDCNDNGVPDECEPGYADDCNLNLVPDLCDVSSVTSRDCNLNGIPDECDIAGGLLNDLDEDGVADECVFGLFAVPVSSTGEHTIDGDTIYLPQGGQTVTFEVYLAGWDPQLIGDPQLAMYQFAIAETSLFSGQNGSLSFPRLPCDTSDDCRMGDDARGLCLADGYCNEGPVLFADAERPDYVFHGLPTIKGVFLNEGYPPFFGGLYFDPDAQATLADNGVPKYCGSFMLDVSPDAEGTFTLDYLIEQTFWGDWDSPYPMPERLPARIALPADCNGNGIPDSEDISSGFSLDVNGNGIPDECEPPVLYVDADASGADNGTSWTDAFNDLQDALDVATSSAGIVEQIWVADGTYAPSRRTVQSDERTATFKLLDGLALYGGFAGTEAALEERDPTANVTVLNGDLNGDDGPGFAGNDENVRHVVTADGNDATAIIDGFAISGGNADGTTVQVGYGGGVFIYESSATVSNCVFTRNSALQGGGGVGSLGSSTPSVTGCTFTGNHATYSGGGALNGSGGEPVYVNCTFFDNTAQSGAGMYSRSGHATAINCLFNANASSSFGAGVFHAHNANATLINCTIAENTSDKPSGAGICGFHSDAIVLHNCILWGNLADGVSDQSAQTSQSNALPPSFNYSCVQGWTGELGGAGNTGGDPLFVDPDGEDDIPGTADDDLRLRYVSSSCVDAGDNGVVSIPYDLDGQTRILDGDLDEIPVVDMGAYEYEGPCFEDADCDDGLNCTGTETCVDQSCMPGVPVDCDDGVGCTVDACDEPSVTCVHAPNDAACDNGLYCDGAEICDPSQDCVSAMPVDCDDGVACTVDSCNESTDQCDHVPDDAFCDNNLYCDGIESCHLTLDCLPGVLVDCDDGIDCTIDTCDETADACDNQPDDAFCDNGLFCDGAEFCDPQTGCQIGPPPCDDGSICTVDICDEDADTCTNDPVAYGDVNYDSALNVFDAFCVLAVIGGTPGDCTLEQVDINPCQPDGVANLFDVFAVLEAIAGNDPCCS